MTNSYPDECECKNTTLVPAILEKEEEEWIMIDWCFGF